jgi:hypothetical protein
MGQQSERKEQTIDLGTCLQWTPKSYIFAKWNSLILEHRLICCLVISWVCPKKPNLHFTSSNNTCRVYHKIQDWLCKMLFEHPSCHVNV